MEWLIARVGLYDQRVMFTAMTILYISPLFYTSTYLEIHQTVYVCIKNKQP